MKNKKFNTQTLLKRRFFAVAAATIGLSILPYLLLLIVTLAYDTEPAKQVSASEMLMPQSSDVDVSDYIADGWSAMIVDNELNVTSLGGEPIFDKSAFTETEWADFIFSLDNTSGYKYDIAYQSGNEGYWLVMRKPISVVIILNLALNSKADHYAKDMTILAVIILVYFAVVIAFVIHYSKRTANEMKAREKLLHGEEEKRMLLVSEISHDLKTPLASVLGYSEMLLSKDVDGQKQREYLQSIYDNSVRSNNILRSLFMYSKLGSAGFKPNIERTDICEYTRQIIAEYIPKFEENGFGYELSVPESEIFVNIDKELFRRVYDNLIENAMKYNKVGTKIMLGVAHKGSTVDITAADNGVGIPSEHIDKIYQPFFRADRTSANRDGSGLGLAIVRQIVTLHGGEISYIGDEDGCKWRISLPTNES